MQIFRKYLSSFLMHVSVQGILLSQVKWNTIPIPGIEPPAIAYDQGTKKIFVQLNGTLISSSDFGKTMEYTPITIGIGIGSGIDLLLIFPPKIGHKVSE